MGGGTQHQPGPMPRGLHPAPGDSQPQQQQQHLTPKWPPSALTFKDGGVTRWQPKTQVRRPKPGWAKGKWPPTQISESKALLQGSQSH